MKNFLTSALSIALCAFIFTGCGHKQPSAETVAPNDTLTVAYNSWVGFTPIVIAQEKGYFAENNLEVDIKVIDDLSASRAAVQSGAVDIVNLTGDMMLTFADAGVDLQAFYAIDWSNGGDGILVTEDIQTWKDFEGKTIAAQEGMPPTNLLLYVLQENGVDLDSITFQELEVSAAALAFKAGKVDIAATYQPYLSEAQSREGSRAFITSADYPYVLNDYAAAKPSLIVENPKAIKRYIAALDKATEFIKTESPEAYEITGKAFGLSANEVKEIFMDVEFPSMEENKKLFTSADIQKTFTTFQDAMLAAGVLQSRVDTTRMITPDFVK